MPDTTYKRLDYNEVVFLCNALFAKLKASPLNTQYEIVLNQGGTAYVLNAVDSNGNRKLVATVSTASDSAAGLLSAALYTKLSGIAAGAQVNIIEGIKVNGVTQTPDGSKVISITIPTVVSDLTNDSGFQTAAQVQTAINTAIAGIVGIDFEIVQELPQTGEKGVIYLLPNSGSGTNTYDEYIWITNGGSSRFEKIGTTDIDLSGYVQASQMAVLSNTEITTAVNNAYTAVFGS